MGVKNLLPNLKSITVNKTLRDYAGKVLGIDGKIWLYRAAMTSPKSAAEGKLTSSMKAYLENCVSHFLACGAAELLFVFDGFPCLAKGQENALREDRRSMCWQLAQEAEQSNNYDKADYYYKRCIRIGHIHVQAFLTILARHQIPYLVAPYEADAQLAYLSIQRAVDVVVSEDSDMLAFGCLEVMFKCDFVGDCQVIRLVDLARNDELSFHRWSPDQFLAFCCLCGCDYLTSLPGVGIKKAHSIVSANSTLPAIAKAIKLQYRADDDYVQHLWRAMWTYRHHIVYDPIRKQTIHLNPPQSGTPLSSIAPDDCMGPAIADSTLAALVKGEMDPQGSLEETLLVDWGFELSLPSHTQGSVNWMTERDRQLIESSRMESTAAIATTPRTQCKRPLCHYSPVTAAAMVPTKSPLLSRRFRRIPPDEGVRADYPSIDLRMPRDPEQPSRGSNSFFDIFFDQSILEDCDPAEPSNALQRSAFSQENGQAFAADSAFTCDGDSGEVVDRTSVEWRIESAKRRRIERLFSSNSPSDA